MTAKELLHLLQELSEEDLNREVIMFDGPAYVTPYRLEVLGNKWAKKLQGKLLID